MTTEVIVLWIIWAVTLTLLAVLVAVQARRIGQLQDLVKDLKAESQRRMDTICKMNEWMDNKNRLLMEQSEDIERLEDAIARLGIGEEPEAVPPQAREG